MELAQLQAAVRQTLVELTMTSHAPSTTFGTPKVKGGATARAPRLDHNPAERYVQAATDGWHSGARLERVLGQARSELERIRRRPMPDVTAVETETDLAARIVRDGDGLPAADVALALRCTRTRVRKARATAGRDPERGRPLPAEVVNGTPMEFGVGLVRNGYSVRAAAALTGVADQSTLHARARRPSAG